MKHEPGFLKPPRRAGLTAGVLAAVAIAAAAPPIAAEPPVSISYEMPRDGFAAVHIYDRDGTTLVRRLYAEIEKQQGTVRDPWDLRDDAGRAVPPGEYVWKALTRPPFQLTYELTVNNAGQPAWWAPAPGKGGGGWLADHGSPNCAAAMGDMMWFGSLCAENGHAAIATDLEGNKLWGTHHIGPGFRGPMYIACDSAAAYLVTPESVFRVVPSRDFQMRKVFSCPPDPLLPWIPAGYEIAGGAAARDGRLYWSIRATPETWLTSSFAAADLDPGKCIPGVGLFQGKGQRAARGDKNYREEDYDELMRLYAAFLTGQTPANSRTLSGVHLPSSTQAWFGDAATTGELAGSVVSVFRTPVVVGTVLTPDATTAVYALKPGLEPAEAVGPKAAPGGLEAGGDDAELDTLLGDFEEDLGDGESTDGKWIRLKAVAAKGGPGVAVAPPGGLQTKALRFKTKRLAFAQVMARRMTDRGPSASRVYGDVKATAGGGWTVQRTADRTICPQAPAAAALVWPEPQELRGISLSHPVFAALDVAVWNGETGPDQAAVNQDEGWTTVGRLEPEPKFNGYFQQVPTCRHVDFGGVVKARAVRVRITAGVELTAGCAGIVAWSPIGDDPAGLPVPLTERIAVLEMPPLDDDKAEARVVKSIPLERPGQLAFDAEGSLLAISDKQVVRVPLAGDAPPEVVVPAGHLDRPSGLAVDGQGRLLVADLASATIKVFDKAGRPAGVIGSGRPAAGPWDPATLEAPMQTAVDAQGRVWVADSSYRPKRIMRFTADGKPDRWFLGPTQYGGGGWMDERDRSRISYNGMLFRIDWAKRDWSLESVVHRDEDPRCLAGAAPPDRPIYHRDRRYLAGITHAPIAAVCEERDGVARPMAAIGYLGTWGDVDRRDDLRKRFGTADRSKLLFVWSDLNGDRTPQADEVQTVAPPGHRLGWTVGEDLTFYAPGHRLRPSSFRPDGVPVYEIAKLEPFETHARSGSTQNIWGTGDGRVFMIGTRLIAPDGRTLLWEFENEFARHEGYYHSGFGFERPPGVLNQEHIPIGHVTLGDEEYFFTNTDPGDWYCYSRDGFLVGCVFGGPKGYGLQQWTMPEWTPGKVDLSGVRLPMEHYQGCVVKADDGKVYAVAGHTHASVVRVEGLEDVRRLQGSVTVSAADVARTRDWETSQGVAAAGGAATKGDKARKALVVPLALDPLPIDGSLSAWPKDVFVTIHERSRGSLSQGEVPVDRVLGALAYNAECLYVAVRVADESPLKNAAADPQRVFQGGDAVDVTLGLDAGADPTRTAPVAGDLRIVLAAREDKKPLAMLYRPVANAAAAERRGIFESPTGRLEMDEVRPIPEATVAVRRETWDELKTTSWTLTAAIPWRALGIDPPQPGVRLRGDIGVLRSDQNGVVTAERLYWSGKSQTVISDLPSEARLVPTLWGDLTFEEEALPGEPERARQETRFIPTSPDGK
ncbi:MAG: hypothetical protein ACKO6B_02735 [Planctomycetia bacterium]